MQLTITPEIETAITQQANQKGVSPQQLALDSLRELFVPVIRDKTEQALTLADFLSGYVGVIRSSEFVEGGAQLSTNTGNKFAALMMQKRQQDQP